MSDQDETPAAGITQPLSILPDRDRIERLERRMADAEANMLKLAGKVEHDHQPRIEQLETIVESLRHVPETLQRLVNSATSQGLVMEKVHQVLEQVYVHVSGKSPKPTPPDSPYAKTQVSRRRAK